MSSITLLRRKVGDLIKEICRGDYVLPHFQRKYVWGEEEISELLDSIREDLYIGAPVVVPCSTHLPLSYRSLPGVSCVDRVGDSRCSPCPEPIDDETLGAEENYAEYEHEDDDATSPETETQISGETSYNFPQPDERDNSSLQDESVSQGVKSPAPPTPKYFVLDGQQRLSTVFYLLNCDTIAKCPHTHRPDKMKYVIFVNIDKVNLANSIYEYIQIVPYGPSKRSNYAKLVSSHDKYITLEDAYKEYLSSGGSSNIFCTNLSKKIGRSPSDFLNLYDFLSKIHNYELDIVEVTHLSDIRKMSLLFDRINRTGVALSLSDLAVAYFHSGFGLDLKRLWKSSVKPHTTKLTGLPTSLQMSEFEKEFDPVLLVLRIMSHMLGKSIKKGDLLANFDPKTLSCKDFMTWWTEAVKYLVEAIQRLHNSYGVYSYKALPNKVTLRLLAAFLYIVDTYALPAKRGTIIPTCGITLDEFIDCWYWTSVFTGRYSKESSPTSEEDTGDFLAFIKSLSSGNSLDLPRFCYNPPVHLNLVKVTKDNYISRAILNLIYLRYLRRPSGLNTIDWFLNSGDLNEVDHIFPVSQGRGPKGGRDSILNKTLVTATTNKSKSGKLPSELIKDMHIKSTKPGNVSLILGHHFINSNAEKAMNSNNYDDFIRERDKEIIEYINKNIFGKCSCCKINVISQYELENISE